MIRGWESKYLPEETGSLRLSKANFYREIGEEDGIGDEKEGDTRVELPGRVAVLGPDVGMPPMPVEAETVEGEPPELIDYMQPGETREYTRSVRVNDPPNVPHLFCMSREPATSAGWDALQGALPNRYDAWTITTNVDQLLFEIGCGIKRWLALNDITIHSINTNRGWVAYPYESTPPPVAIEDLQADLHIARWFQKRRKYRGQQEYRLAWVLNSPQWETFPDVIEVELTRTGISLFNLWYPPA